ncbi:MFS transporter [Pelagibacteraceae bacterium]|nr:MFS transporter [Pelagibacteraceae bacterium]
MMKEKFFQNKLALITLLSACGIVAVSMGLRQTFGLFSDFFVKDLQCTVTQFGLAIGIQMLMWGMFAPIFGAMADKIGGNKVTIIAFLFFALGIYLLYSGPNTGIFFQINLGLLVGIGLGGTAISVQIGEVGKHFPNKTRGLAIGIVVAMASIGYFFSPLYTKFALSEFGWEKTLQTFLYFIIFGMIAAIFLLPVKKDKMKGANTETHQQTIPEALKEAFRHKGFILLTFGFFVCGFNITLVSAHIPGYIQERGFELWTAFAILSLIGLFNIFGTLTFGYLSGKYSKKMLLSILYFSRGIVLILFLVLPTSTYVALGFGILYGYLWLSTIPPTNGIISQVFGTKYLAMLYGLVFFSHQIGSFFGAYLGGYFFDQYGSYDYAWYLSIALSFFATVVHLPIDERPLPRLATT